MNTSIFASAGHPFWKRIFMILSLASLILLPILSIPHGMTGDEWLWITYGNDIYDYFFGGSQLALDYDRQNWAQVSGLHYYSGFYEFTVSFLHRTLFPSVDELNFRHIINSMVGGGLFIYTGLLAARFGGWRSGVLAFIFIALSPRILGESMNNSKDIPFAFACTFFLYYLLAYLSSENVGAQWKSVLFMGLGLGMAFGFSTEGLQFFPYTLLFLIVFFLWDKSFRSKLKNTGNKALLWIPVHLITVFFLACIIGIMFWPWALQDPFSRIGEALDILSSRAVPLRMLYEGAYTMNHELPALYTIKWLFISSPVLILLAFLASLVFVYPLSRRYGKANLFVLLFCGLFPLAYAIYRPSVIYETWRRFFFIYPCIVVLAALLLNYLLEKASFQKKYQYVLASVIIAGMAFPLAWIIKSFPNEYVYFNEFSGGIKKAEGQYDLDYALNSGKQAADWIKENTKSTAGKTIVASNMIQVNRYFEQKADLFTGVYVRYNDRDAKDWDYYITYARNTPLAQLKAGTWPPANAVHTIFIDGIPVSAVLERKTKSDMAARSAMDMQQLDRAFLLYQEAVAADASNETVLVRYATLLAQRGAITQALSVLDQALKIDSGSPAVYNLQLQIYRSAGDHEKARAAENMLRSVMQ